MPNILQKRSLLLLSPENSAVAPLTGGDQAERAMATSGALDDLLTSRFLLLQVVGLLVLLALSWLICRLDFRGLASGGPDGSCARLFLSVV